MRAARAFGQVLITGAILLLAPQVAHADEGGAGFWLPGTYGSAAAEPATPGWSVSVSAYGASADAGADVVRARDIRIGDFDVATDVQISGHLQTNSELVLLSATYVFTGPVLGGRASFGVGATVGRTATFQSATVRVSMGRQQTIRSFSARDSIVGVGDFAPIASLAWSAGADSFMVYATGNIPVGYDPHRLANMGIGHGAVDGGAGYTLRNARGDFEASAVAGFTYNLENAATDYRNGVDFHLDWAASQALSRALNVGIVGYVYRQITGDGGAGDKVGPFLSRVAAVGPQVTYAFGTSKLDASLNLKGYTEFDAGRRPAGYNIWLTLTLSPHAAGTS
ncbi:MAG TPA: transporter [Caulobacteraceae bacterium]|nr:transporter [Caulobacteraceae bacterium]